jgi:hypothetical protein
MMRSDPIFALVVGVLLIVLVVLSRRLCRCGKRTPAAAKPPRAKREPKPFAGLTRKPDCPVCEQEAEVPPSASAPHGTSTPYDVHPRPPSPRRYHRPLLPPYRLLVPRPGRLGKYPRQWPSQRPALAPTALPQLQAAFPGNSWHAISRQAG